MRTIEPRPRTRRALLALGMLALGVSARPIEAQAASAAPGKPRVLLAQFELTPAASVAGEVFARMLEFGLTTRGFPTVDASGDAVCVVGDTPQPAAGEAPAARLRPGEFYVTGRMDGDSTTFELSYRVRRCEAQGMSDVTSDQQRIAVKESLALFEAIADHIADRVEDVLTRTSVAVAPFTVASAAAGYAEDLTAGMRQALRSSSVLLPIERGGRYRLNGRFAVVQTGSARAVNGTLALFRANEPLPFDSVRFASRIDSVPSALLDVTQSIASRIELDRLAGDHPVQRVAPKAESLVAEATRLLAPCAEGVVPCPAASLAQAVALLSLAAEMRPRDWRIQYLLGRTEFRQRNYEAAAGHLAEDFDLWSRAPTRDASGGALILNTLAEVYRATDNPMGALEANRKSLALIPGQTTVLEMEAENLRLLHRPGEAFTIVAELAAHAPELPSVQTEFILLLRSAPDTVLSRRLEVILSLCRRSSTIARQCVEAITPTSSIGASSGVAARGVTVARNLLTLQELPADTRGALFGIVASAELGNVHYSSQGDEATVRTPDVNHAALRATLAEASLLPGDSLSPRTREWLTRISALEHFGGNQVAEGYAEAERARAILASPGSEFVHALGNYLVARNIDTGGTVPGPNAGGSPALYRAAADALLPLVRSRYSPAYHIYRAANHHLNEDVRSRSEFLALLRDTVNDATARKLLILVCVDYLYDFACGHRQYLAMEKRGGLQSPGDSLSATEAAVLADQYSDASRWLGSTAGRQRDACYMSIAYFYATWLASVEGSQERLAVAHGHWKDAMLSRRTSHSGCGWKLGAAEARLHAEPSVTRIPLFTAMIAAMRDNAAPLPDLP